MRRGGWITAGVAGAVLAAVLGTGFVVQRAVLPMPKQKSVVALRAATWLQRHRLVQSSFTVNGGPMVTSSCLQAWFVVDGKRSRGALLRADDGYVLFAVPPHTLLARSAQGAESSSPLVLLELAGCPRVLVRRLDTLAQERQGLTLDNGRLAFVLKGTHVTLTLDTKSGAPTAVAVRSAKASGRAQIRFVSLTPPVQRQLSAGLTGLHALNGVSGP
ncbi:MAG: hypothetical protein JOY72_11355 [Actinobacteria bacterium]|nr:hypothetical protein [Actinomycetota bacterium]